MKHLHLIRIGILVFVSLLMYSCVKDADFIQEEPVEVLPVFESNLLVSSFRASDFLDNDTKQEVLALSDTTAVELMPSDYPMNQLHKAELFFELTNSIDRDFIVNFEFLNDLNEVTYTIKVPVSSGSIEKSITVEINVSIEEPELARLKEAEKLVYRITLPISKTLISSDTEGFIELNSIVTMLLEI